MICVDSSESLDKKNKEQTRNKSNRKVQDPLKGWWLTEKQTQIKIQTNVKNKVTDIKLKLS